MSFSGAITPYMGGAVYLCPAQIVDGLCIHTKLQKRESAATRSFGYRVQPSTSRMAKAESSKAAANGIKPNPNAAGGANYELPWYVIYPILTSMNLPSSQG